MARPIGTLGTIDTLVIGSFTTATPNSVIHLGCEVATGTANNFSSFRKMFTTTGYAVTSGKTLKCRQFIAINNIANQYMQLGYGDTSVSSSTSAPTTPIYDIGFDVKMFISSTAYAPTSWNLIFDVPATKIPFVRVATSGTHGYQLFGFEV